MSVPTDPDADPLPRANTKPRVHTMRLDQYDRMSVREAIHTAQYGGDRNLYSALGYVQQPRFAHFEARYKRNGTARALVDKPAKDCWGEVPTIKDDTESDEEKTDFEHAVASFLDGDATRGKPTKRMEDADSDARLGEFSLILLGLADDGAADGDEEALENPVDEGSVGTATGGGGDGEGGDALDDIAYLEVYDQGQAPIDGIEYVTDPMDERFGRPETYSVDLGRGRGTVDVHHSRLIHVAEDADLFSDSVLLRSLNRLDDLEKLLGGGAEAFWRSAYQGLIIRPPEGATSSARSSGSLEQAGSKLHEQIKKYRHNLNREIFTSGQIDTLDANVNSPKDHLAGQYAEIAAGHDIPQSILQGNETGERATSEDRAMYHEYIARRRRQHCESAILRPIIDRLIELGIFPTPDNEDETYEVEWPALDELSEEQEADIRSTNAQALERVSGGMPSELATVGERRKLMGWDPEIGSEVDEEERPETATDPEEEDEAVRRAIEGLQQRPVDGDGEGAGEGEEAPPQAANGQ